MHRRRASLRRSAIERLEVRDLLSAMGPVRPTHVELPDSYQGVAEVVSSIATLQDGRITSRHPAGSGLDDRDRIARAGNGNGLAPLSTVPNGSETAVETKRPPSQDAAPRELADPLVFEARRTDTASDALAGDPPALGQEMAPGVSGGAASDSAVASSVVGWAPGTAMAVIMSAIILPGEFDGSDGRAGASAAGTSPAGSVGNVVRELEIPEPAPGDARMALDLPGDEPLKFPVRVADSDRDAPAWANLLEGALHLDWDVVDGELRQFLSGLGGLAQHPDGYGARPTWPLWIGAATALLLARRAGWRRLSPRPVQGVLWESPRRPVPVGPWPMGPP
jgi:hypothetical protein